MMAQQLAGAAEPAAPEVQDAPSDGKVTFSILQYVQAHPGSTASEISTALGMKRTANVSALLLRYIRGGVVKTDRTTWPPRYTMTCEPEKLDEILHRLQKGGRLTERWKMLLQANGELLQWVAADKPPEDDRTVLVWNGGTTFGMAWHNKHLGWVEWTDGTLLSHVTHWADVLGPPALRAQHAGES
jgi:hypothetical protein